MHKTKQITDFHAERAKGVGASDIPILAGLMEKYDSTALTLWMEKTGRSPRWEGNEKTDFGHRLEPIILQKYIDNHNLKSKPRLLTECRHPDYNFALAHADMIYKKDYKYHIVEAKSTGYHSGYRKSDDPDSGYDKEDFSENGVPASVFLQVQWQMFVYGIDNAFVAALIDTNDFREYGPIKFNVSIIDKCLALARRFWDHIENDTPPKPKTFNDVNLIFPEKDDTSKIIDGDDLLMVNGLKEQYSLLKKREKKTGIEKDEIKNAIALIMQKNKYLNDPEGNKLASLSSWQRESVSLKDIKEHKKIFKLIEKENLIKKSVSSRLTF